MKNSVKMIAGLFLAAVLSAPLLTSCGSRDDNPGGVAFNPNDPNNPFGPFSQAAAHRGSVQITNRAHYKRYLLESGLCVKFIFNGCAWIDQSPLMTLQFRGTEVTSHNGIFASVLINSVSDNGFPSGSVPYQTQFFNIENNQALEALTFGFAGTRSYNGQIRLVVQGKPADTDIYVTLEYRNQDFGTARLRRNSNQFQPGIPGQFPNQFFRRPFDTGW